MLKVVICGSYHRDSESLKRLFRELETNGCRILSPISIEFENINTPVVKNKNELDLTINELEIFHLRAIRDADFIWLHSPMGHVGVSGSFEVGYAQALGKPVFCKELPHDDMLHTRVIMVNSVFEVIETVTG